MTAWLTGITLAAYLLGGLRLICYQRNGARYRRLISLVATAIVAACLCGAVEILFYHQQPSPSQTVLAVVICLLCVRSRGNLAHLFRGKNEN